MDRRRKEFDPKDKKSDPWEMSKIREFLENIPRWGDSKDDKSKSGLSAQRKMEQE